ncbi:hypothetical protein ACIRVK_24215 [Streptomyces sp. NPDC101152]|uniref:hypothetical protein n=1 Tax=Streptomyces sp. NPDC101152 TaxID=3366116 RepID=UPI00382B0B14
MRAAAVLGCLNVALDHRPASDGELDLVTLLVEAFAAPEPALPAVSSSGPPPPTSTAE